MYVGQRVLDGILFAILRRGHGPYNRDERILWAISDLENTRKQIESGFATEGPIDIFNENEVSE